LLYAVKQVELAIRSHLDEIVGASNVTALQYTALTVLGRQDGLSSAELARNSFVTAQSMADLVAALGAQGLIERRRDPDNRRRLLISLTDSGRDLLDRHEAAVKALEKQMLSTLSNQEAADFRRMLNACRAALADEPAR
jgi:DNA-binding MarR family transcriptional regulator